MKIDLVGKIKNTQVPRTKALLPMFEAVVNAFQAIEDATQPGVSPSIEIFVQRDSTLPGVEMDGEVNGFTITDNGIGFNDINLDAFFTSDTQYKLSRGGKGVGRFMWLKAFDYAEIESHYRVIGKLNKRAFKFSIDADHSPQPPTESKEKQSNNGSSHIHETALPGELPAWIVRHWPSSCRALPAIFSGS